MGSRRLVLGLVVAVSVGSLNAESLRYEGTLVGPGGSGDGALFVTGWDWTSSETTLKWVVDNQATPGKWHYWYEVSVPNRPAPWADIQCVVIEATGPDPGPAFTAANLSSLSVQPESWGPTLRIGWHEPDPYDLPDLPEEVYGIRLCSEEDPVTVTISFDSDRGPRWGDFYADAGYLGEYAASTALFNAGFTALDPTEAPRSGSASNHVLVPDALPNGGPTVIPAPAAMLLGGLGAVLTGLSRRRGWL